MIFFKKEKNNQEKARVRCFVFGRVQGVFFRESVVKQANKLNLFGWVKNLKNGRVEAVFEGEKEKVNKIMKWIKRGPILAKVDKVDFVLEDYRAEFKDFEIHYDI